MAVRVPPAWRLAVLYALLVLAGVAVAASSGRPVVPDAALAVDRALYTDLAALDAPVPADPGRPVGLPHRCEPPDGQVSCTGLYRLTFDRRPDEAAEPWAVYVPTFGSRLIVSVNGYRLADSRPVRTGALVNQAGPFLVTIPPPVLRAGENALDLRMEGWSRTAGHIDRVFVGPDAAVRPAYRAREALLVTLPRLLIAWQAALALSLLIVWLGRREEWTHLTMGIILGLGVLHGLPLFLAGANWPDWLLRAANLTGLWQATLLPGLMASLVGRPRPLPLRWAVVVPGVVSAAFAAVAADPGLFQPWFRWLWLLGAMPWALAMAIVSAGIVINAAFRRNHAAARIICGGLLAIMPLMGHDALVFLGVLADQRPYLSRFAAPFLLTVISATLMWRFAMALNEVSRFNAKLRREVAAAEEALRASFAREQAQIRATALESERLRLTRDLHDGLAGQLVSMVAQCELRGPEYREVALAARRALDDLRLVVASLDDVGNDLAMMLALFRERIGPQLQAQGMELHWRMAPLPDVEGLRSEHALALFRLLQEAVTNAVRHSGCREVTIAMAPAPAERPGRAVRIVVADRGRGGFAERPGGRGIANMRRRAAVLGADLGVESGEGGTRITIDLPHALPDLAPAGDGAESLRTA
ncbi:ATP-binding protein [Azospirillum halopraeferens]|uniref:ATP-binding protein n=1 Tax=Azospirillum halopraeferens TaxID=34010 RepID=UPI00040392C5|nr:ATP-binding protein [Azospirillum halopraeferens]